MAWQRSGIEARIKSALAKGWSVSKWIEFEKEKGRSYRRTEMLADWRMVGEIKRKEGAARFIRKGYVPAEHTIEVTTWARMSKEYMYRLKVERIIKGEVVESRHVNFCSDKILPVEAVEREAFLRAFNQSPPLSGEERSFIVETVYKRPPK